MCQSRRETLAVLVIDMTNCFADPKGSLYVPGAQLVGSYISRFINSKSSKIDYIVSTTDWHPRNHIGSVESWIVPEGMDIVTAEDLQSGKALLRFPIHEKEDILEYIRDSGPLHLWPEHGVKDTSGSCPIMPLEIAYRKWQLIRPENFDKLETFKKGQNPFRENWSIFSYQSAPSGSVTRYTEAGKELAEKLAKYDKILVCGVAKEYCVGLSVRDMITAYQDLFKGKLIFVPEMMVAIDEDAPGNSVYQEAIDGGFAEIRKRSDF